jgi:two-component system, chemotaxis family, CheB/CheR fusion protein
MAEIQAQGGVTFAQDDSSARYNSMPHSAVAAGCVDYVLPPRRIATELARIAEVPFAQREESSIETASKGADNGALNSIFQLLRRSTGVDFTHYRQTTILRRIQRRMLVHKLERIEEYVRHLRTHSTEIKSLYQDMLINVTSFFRNPELFDLLKSTVFPAILKNRGPDSAVRIWTPACASGEETYSVAISLLESLGDQSGRIPIQFFGTDVSETSIAKARNGTYPENIQADVSPERLRQFFTKVEGGYRIAKTIRDVCIFAQHNILNDPPFSQMDLICCRNLLIYLEPVLQTKAISIFHYAIRGKGFLVLGSSEGVGISTNLFSTEERTHKIFSKKAGTIRQIVSFSLNRRRETGEYEPLHNSVRQPRFSPNYVEAQKEFDRRLVSKYVPATVFVNDDMEVIHSRGNVNRYLKLPPGTASLSVLKMVREGLLFDMRNAIARAKKENAMVRKTGVSFKVGNGNGNVSEDVHPKPPVTRGATFEVTPLLLGQPKEMYFMIVFRDEHDGFDAPAGKTKKSRRKMQQTEVYNQRAIKLEQELTATKEYLQSVIETQEATNEELQSANEEILSSNEELQSTNEELETAKEELQSANEELSTVNDELRSRNLEITNINNDLTNLLSIMGLTVVMLAPDVTIRHFTPQAEKTLGLIPADIGRPFLNINPPIQVPNLQQMVVEVIGNSKPIEKEVSAVDGNLYQLKILPYRTADGRHEGAVLTLAPAVKA